MRRAQPYEKFNMGASQQEERRCHPHNTDFALTNAVNLDYKNKAATQTV